MTVTTGDVTTQWEADTIPTDSGASIPIYRWRQMRHGQFWGE